jgi:hypothetical protein
MTLFERLASAAWGALAAFAAGQSAGLIPAAALKRVELCLFHALTGLDCPGCGMTRALVAAFRGHWVDASRLHPLALPLIGVWTAWLAWGAANRLRGRDFSSRWPDLFAGARGWAGVAVVLGVWLARAH